MSRKISLVGNEGKHQCKGDMSTLHWFLMIMEMPSSANSGGAGTWLMMLMGLMMLMENLIIHFRHLALAFKVTLVLQA